jgi:hypothetical protein
MEQPELASHCASVTKSSPLAGGIIHGVVDIELGHGECSATSCNFTADGASSTVREDCMAT